MIFPTTLRTPNTHLGLFALSQSTDASVSGTDQSTLAKPQIDLGLGLEVTTLIPGRFANAIQKNINARHALQEIREDTTSSFVLILEPDGSATIYRGWRYLFFNDGPQVHTMEHIREQMGYSGRWEQRGKWVNVDVILDDNVCPRIEQYSHLIPYHFPKWHLRCLPIVPTDHSVLVTPVLACQSANAEPIFGEDEPHIVDDVLPGRWILLGAGNGLLIKMASSSISGDEVPIVQIEYSPELVQKNAWEHSF